MSWLEKKVITKSYYWKNIIQVPTRVESHISANCYFGGLSSKVKVIFDIFLYYNFWIQFMNQILNKNIIVKHFCTKKTPHKNPEIYAFRLKKILLENFLWQHPNIHFSGCIETSTTKLYGNNWYFTKTFTITAIWLKLTETQLKAGVNFLNRERDRQTEILYIVIYSYIYILLENQYWIKKKKYMTKLKRGKPEGRA